MILLTSTQTLEVLLGAAITTNQLTYVASYVDEVTTTIQLGSVGSFDGVTNNTSAVTMVTSPATNQVRRISGFTIYNNDTVAAIVTIQVNDNGTTRTVWKGLLIDAYTLTYDDVRGFTTITSDGEVVVTHTNVGVGSSSSSSVAAHATSHESGGSDSIPLDALAAPSDITTLNSSTTKHGLLPKLSGVADDNLKGDGTWSSTVNAANLSGTITSATQDLITRLGTIVSGAWNGTKIGLAYGGTNVDLSASGGTTKILAQDASHVISARDLVAGDIPSLAASKITSGQLALARGGTNADLSATGGTSQFLKQASAGAAITVVQPASSDLSDSSNIPLLNVANTFTGTNTQTITGSTNADFIALSLRNTNNGSSASTKFQVGNDSAANRGEFLNFSSTVGASGAQNPDQFTMQGRGTNGVAITGIGTVPVSFYVNNVLVGRFAGATGNLTIGTDFNCSTSSNFSWTAKSFDTVYQAASDGFVVGSVVGGSITIKSDSSNPPTTNRTSANVSGDTVPFCCPVRKGDYYKIVSAGGASAAVGPFWVPIGVNG